MFKLEEEEENFRYTSLMVVGGVAILTAIGKKEYYSCPTSCNFNGTQKFLALVSTPVVKNGLQRPDASGMLPAG